MGARKYRLGEHCADHAADKMTMLQTPNRLLHSCLGFRAVLKSHPYRNQHRQSLFRASPVAPLPEPEKRADATHGTTNAFLRRETWLRTRPSPLFASGQLLCFGSLNRHVPPADLTTKIVNAQTNKS